MSRQVIGGFLRSYTKIAGVHGKMMEQDPSGSILLGIPNCANLCVISSTLVDSQFIVEGSLGASRKRYNPNYTLKATRHMYRYRAGDCWVGLWTAV